MIDGEDFGESLILPELPIEQEQAKQKAEFCLRLNIAPSEYDGLTLLEIDAFVTEYNRQQEESKRKGVS